MQKLMKPAGITAAASEGNEVAVGGDNGTVGDEDIPGAAKSTRYRDWVSSIRRQNPPNQPTPQACQNPAHNPHSVFLERERMQGGLAATLDWALQFVLCFQ